MSRVRVAAFSVSLDGFGAGPDQRLDQPLGEGGMAVHGWLFATRTFQRVVLGKDGGTTGVDDDFAAKSFEGVGAEILGRNMFGPVRGPWPDENWRGWWGENPPFHVPVFVLTHHPRKPLEMAGGTTFHFITEGHREALRLATEAAGGGDIRIGGGAATIRQYLREGLIDELHLAVAPVLLGSGEPLYQGLDWKALGYEVVDHVFGEAATHVVIARRG
jgi:dihydrofolate reductase